MASHDASRDAQRDEQYDDQDDALRKALTEHFPLMKERRAHPCPNARPH